jgi:hypothetical protein
MCIFARLLSKTITRACGMNFRALFTPANQTSRIEYGTHASKPPPKIPPKYGYVEHGVISSFI